MDAVSLIEYLNELAGKHGVGRTDLMEDRMLGLKVRENYEHPAATTLLNAHEALEGLVLTKEERSFKTGSTSSGPRRPTKASSPRRSWTPSTASSTPRRRK